MINLLEHFFYNKKYKLTEIIVNSPNEEFEIDISDYHVVDGEEADYGKIDYYKLGVLVCTYINYGGDSDEYIFTEEGKKYFGVQLMVYIEKWMASDE